MKKESEPADIWIYQKGSDDIYKQKILLAYNSETTKVEAIGNAAQDYLPCPIPPIVVSSPLTQGQICDYVIFEKILESILHERLGKKKAFFKPSIELCLPDDIPLTEVSIKAYTDAFYQAGAKKIMISQRPFEEAIQMLLPSATMVCGIIMEHKERYLREQIQFLKTYADKNGFDKTVVLKLIENMYEK